jgi:hypothetical protein
MAFARPARDTATASRDTPRDMGAMSASSHTARTVL